MKKQKIFQEKKGIHGKERLMLANFNVQGRQMWTFRCQFGDTLRSGSQGVVQRRYGVSRTSPRCSTWGSALSWLPGPRPN